MTYEFNFMALVRLGLLTLAVTLLMSFVGLSGFLTYLASFLIGITYPESLFIPVEKEK